MKNGLKILSLVFGGTSLLMSVEGAKAAVMIPVTCQKMQVGTINVDVVGTGVQGGFTTTPMFPTLADAAAKCEEDHFNWYQVIMKDNMPPVDAGGKRLTPPYDDPPLGGYGNDPTTAGDDTQWADNLPWYWDEGADPPAGTPGFQDGYNLNDQVMGGLLKFSDFPGGPDGTMVSFMTWLASVNADGSLHKLHGGFSWDYVDPVGPVGASIQNLKAKPVPEPSSIGSSIFALLVALKQLAKRRHEIKTHR